MMRVLAWMVLALAGWGLIQWASRSLPPDTNLMPVPVRQRTTAGPYRWARHPMYIGNLALIMGLGGMAAGLWNALALGVLGVLVMAEWAGREESVE